MNVTHGGLGFRLDHCDDLCKRGRHVWTTLAAAAREALNDAALRVRAVPSTKDHLNPADVADHALRSQHGSGELGCDGSDALHGAEECALRYGIEGVGEVVVSERPRDSLRARRSTTSTAL